MSSAETYAFDMSMSVEASDRTISMDATGVADRPARKIRMDMSMSGVMSRDITTYLDNQTAYVNVDGRWRTQDISDRNVWDSRDQLARQRELLNASTVTLAGNDTVDGTPVRVLELTPDEGQLRELVEQQTGSSLGDVSMSDVSFRYYVATDTDQVRKIEMDAEMSADGNSGSVSMTMRFSDFGSDVSVEIPEEATAGTAT
jgi:outer membrane lipoprotein-sorting protein